MPQNKFTNGWDDVIQAVTATRTPATAGAGLEQYGTTGFYLYTLTDNAGTDEVYQAGFQIPHAYQAGGDSHLHIHVIPSANGSAGNEDVVLKLQYQWVNINAAFSTTTNSSDTQTFRVGAAEANKHILWEWDPAQSGTGKTLSSALITTITRLSKTDAADNYTGKIYILFVDTHVYRDSIGSIQEVTK